MKPQCWRAIKRILCRAGSLENGKRKRYLENACGRDRAMRVYLESLLGIKTDDGPLRAHSSLVNTLLLHYRVLAKIAEGATCSVYRARDLSLGRLVALKVLAPLLAADAERTRRFLLEAQYASAASHPNIVAIHDVACDHGVTFIVMEYARGKTLARSIPQDGLPLRGCLAWALQIAEALAHAHWAKIAHIDLTPSNIVITPEGSVKILDFGLATPFPSVRGQSDAPPDAAKMTRGTVGYLAPEQISGQAADARSDIFSFGSVFFEMLTGRRAFPGASRFESLAATLKETPVIYERRIPKPVLAIVNRCLEKDPRRRFQNAGELARKLRLALRQIESRQRELRTNGRPASLLEALQTPAPAPAYSLAVVPFVGALGNPVLQESGTAIAESLINHLSRIPELRILARTTSFRLYRDHPDLKSLCAVTNADAILAGSVEPYGSRVKIQVDLIDTATGNQIWGCRYLTRQKCGSVPKRLAGDLRRFLHARRYLASRPKGPDPVSGAEPKRAA